MFLPPIPELAFSSNADGAVGVRFSVDGPVQRCALPSQADDDWFSVFAEEVIDALSRVHETGVPIGLSEFDLESSGARLLVVVHLVVFDVEVPSSQRRQKIFPFRPTVPSMVKKFFLDE